MDRNKLIASLRNGSSPDLRNRRAIFGLSLGAAGAMGLIGLYQLGVLRHLPEPPLRIFDADKVDASPEAYPFSTPDASLGLASYGLTAVLAAAGEPGRARTKPWLALALGAKVLGDALVAAKLTLDQIFEHKALCLYCLLAAAASAAMVPLAFRETREALLALRAS